MSADVDDPNAGATNRELVATRMLLYRVAYPNEDDRFEEDPEPIEAAKMAVERIHDLEEQNRKLRDRVEDLEDDVEKALDAVADGDTARADGGQSRNQKGPATRIARNAVVKRTAEGIDAGARNPDGSRSDLLGAVTVSDVQDMAEPEHTLDWTPVDRAFTDLARRWRSLEYDEDAEPKQLKVRSIDALRNEPGLVEAVERSLARDDLTNALLAGVN